MHHTIDAPLARPGATALRLLATRRGRLILLALAALPPPLIGGVRAMDADVPGYLVGLARGGVAVPADRGFLLEGLLPDGLGIALARLGVPAEALHYAWWGLGLAALSAVALVSLGRGEIRYPHLLLLVAFGHGVDTLALWVGKFDPWLMACLLLSAWRARAPATLGAGLAALCHPVMAVLSTAGVVAADLALGRRLRLAECAAAILLGGADLAIAHRLVPGLVDRGGYASGLAAGLLHDAALLGAPTLVSAALVPFFLVRRFAGPFRYGGPRGAALLGAWAAGALFVGCAATLDHTRVLFLLTLAPAVAFLRHQDRAAPPERWDWGLFALLYLCRLALPQIDGDGAVAATPYPLAPWPGP